MLHGLYVLTDSKYIPHQQWAERVEKILLAGANIIQLREKTLTEEQLLPHALQLQEICHYYGAIFIINDHIRLTKKINASGVHIGRHDSSLRHAREYLGKDFIIGVSCYKHIYAAIQAQTLAADYVAFGSMHPSYTKVSAIRCPLGIISQSKRCLSIPVCAIGGISHKNVSPILRAGADMIATSHSVFNADDPSDSANKIFQQVIMSR